MAGLQEFIVEQIGEDGWNRIVQSAGIDRRRYSRLEAYPDSELTAIVAVLVEEYDWEARQLQREFGQYLFQSLADIYARIYFDEEWDAIEMIDNVEETIHQSLKRRSNAEFTPPELETERLGEDEIAILYRSDRQLCDLGKGLAMGVGNYYDTPLAIEETTCMKDGDAVCRMEVARLDERPPPETDARTVVSVPADGGTAGE